jgi:hypothetical protein
MKQDIEEKSNLFVLKAFFLGGVIIISLLYIFKYLRYQGLLMLQQQNKDFFISA